MPFTKVGLYSLTQPFVRAWWRFNRGVTLGARVIAEDEAGRVALVRQTYTHGLHLPGGGVERDEDVETAALRELAEEAGAEPVGPFEFLGLFANFAAFRGDHIALFRVRVRPAPGGRPPDGEISEVVWCDPLAPPDDLTSGARRRLAEVYAGAPKRSEW